MNNNKLTICFFGEAKKEDIFTLRLAKYFEENGHNVHLISYTEDDGNLAGNIKIHIIKKKIKTSLKILDKVFNRFSTIFEVKNILKKIKPDIIHGHCVTSYGTLAALSGFHPLVVTAWGSDILINPKKSKFTKAVTKYVLKKADLITCDAEHMKKEMEKLGADGKKIKIIYFGVDTRKFSPGEKNNGLLAKLSILKSDKIVISLRALKPIYNVETLIRAIPVILKEIPNAKFIIAGKGTEEKKLADLAKKLGVFETIRFVGWISPQDLPSYLRTADIYVSTSLSDGGIASSTAEAMACGLPAVITDTGNNRDWVEDNGSGFLIPIKDYKKLAEKTVFLMENEFLKKKLGENARKKIQENNDYYNEMGKMEKIYYNLAKKHE